MGAMADISGIEYGVTLLTILPVGMPDRDPCAAPSARRIFGRDTRVPCAWKGHHVAITCRRGQTKHAERVKRDAIE